MGGGWGAHSAEGAGKKKQRLAAPTALACARASTHSKMRTRTHSHARPHARTHSLIQARTHKTHSRAHARMNTYSRKQVHACGSNKVVALVARVARPTHGRYLHCGIQRWHCCKAWPTAQPEVRKIGALAVHPSGATAANGTALRETVGANTALDEGLKFGLVTRTNERTNIG